MNVLSKDDTKSPEYNFYYDESEHSRKINYETVVASNYYDNFVAVIVGLSKEKERDIFEKYAAFESKYASRKDSNGELKSTTLKQNNFKYGFASLNKQNVQFVDDFLSVFDKEVHFYFAIASKIEYIILQLFSGYGNNLLIDADAMKYTITKALVTYRPKEIIKCIYDSLESFVDELKAFFRERIEYNKKNIDLKQHESTAFKEIISFLENISVIPEQRWDYHMPFDGFRKYLQEEQIENYFLLLDKEGKSDEVSKTLQAACEMGLHNSKETNSLNSCGLRMADMMAGIISKLLKSLCDSLRYHSIEEGIEKKLLDTKWFQMNEYQLDLYKKLYKIICEWDHAWYKSYAGIYSDDLITFISLLNFMNHFESVEQINTENVMMQGEYFNSFVCKQLLEYFERRKHKLPIEPIPSSSKEYFINRRGAKVYYDIKKQPILTIIEGSQKFDVLSVGMSRTNCPLITISENGQSVCYRLSQELSEWAYTVIGMADMGEKLFPSQVIFSNVNGKYYADIL